MNFRPENKRDVSRVFFLFSLALALSLLLIFQLTKEVKKFQRLINFTSPLIQTTSRSLIQPHDPFCQPKTGADAWVVENGQIRTFPRCLTVLNARFGARFNFDWYSSRQTARSSVLGVLEDEDANFNIRINDQEKSEQVFPLLPGGSSFSPSINLTPASQKINFANGEFLLSLNIISPFSPSKDFNEENVKMNTAPFFFLEFEAVNKTNQPQTKTILFSLGSASIVKNQQGLEIIYFNDKAGNGAVRALAFPENELKPSIVKKHGLIAWQIELQPQSSAVQQIIYAGFYPQPVITDTSADPVRKLKFSYTQWFSNIEEVIFYAWENKKELREKTALFEQEILTPSLSPQVRWLLAQSFHSYLANTWLVWDEAKNNNFEYYVWEGEFKYFNTLDVCHDYAVLEGLYFPWVLKLELDSWQKHAKKDEQGTVIPHDLGSRFQLKGVSDFKIPGWQTSGMPVEENANFIILSYWYWKQSGDDKFTKQIAPFINELIDTLIKKDSNNNGIADQNIKITTYDNEANSALNHGPDNTYLGVKQLSAYLASAEIFSLSRDEKARDLVLKQAQLITKTLNQAFKDYGFIPLSVDPEFKEKNLFNNKEVYGVEEQGFTFVTGLFYPSLTNLESEYLESLAPALKETYAGAYQKSLVFDEQGKTVGLQLAENQALNLGWFSHSIIGDYIAKKLFNFEYHSEEIFFPLLFDSPSAFTDGYYFKPPFYPPQTALTYYPRGAAIFSFLVP